MSGIDPKNKTDRSKWYALAEETEQEERKQSASRPKAPQGKKTVNANRGRFYEAAGVETPDEEIVEKDFKEKGYDIHDPDSYVKESKGRKAPPFIGIGVVAAGLLFGTIFIVRDMRKSAAEVEAEAARRSEFRELPKAGVEITDASYGFTVHPPLGFQRYTEPLEPQEMQGVFNPEIHVWYSFRDAKTGVELHVFGEIRDGHHGDLKRYLDLLTEGFGSPGTPIPDGPDGLKATGATVAGRVVSGNGKKALVYGAFTKPNRLFGVYVVAPEERFAAAQEVIEGAARGVLLKPPFGPTPGKSFVRQE